MASLQLKFCENYKAYARTSTEAQFVHSFSWWQSHDEQRLHINTLPKHHSLGGASSTTPVVAEKNRNFCRRQWMEIWALKSADVSLCTEFRQKGFDSSHFTLLSLATSSLLILYWALVSFHTFQVSVSYFLLCENGLQSKEQDNNFLIILKGASIQ